MAEVPVEQAGETETAPAQIKPWTRDPAAADRQAGRRPFERRFRHLMAGIDADWRHGSFCTLNLRALTALIKEAP